MNGPIELHPLTRVEGHGTVKVYLDGKRVERVELSLFESPRFLEALVLGKRFEEVPEIICRICSLCSTIHRITAIMAIEKALDLQVSEQARLHREIIVNGGHIQSHALHLFCLTLPDVVGVSGLPQVAKVAPELLKKGLAIKGVGNDIQEFVGGRLIHPVTLIPGGMGKPLSKAQIVHLRESLNKVLPDAVEAVELFANMTWKTALPPPRAMALTGDDASPLFGEDITISGGETYSVMGYAANLKETAVPPSGAKKSLFAENTTAVGALSRLKIGFQLAPMAANLFDRYESFLNNADMHQNNLAQAIELVHALEHADKLLEQLLSLTTHAEPFPTVTPRKGEGTAATEAPRGTLIHSYRFDHSGLCTGADVVTPTAINQESIEKDLLLLARQMEGESEEEMLLSLERLVRSYDPCISCAVHLVQE